MSSPPEPKRMMTSEEREALRHKLLDIQDDLAQPVARRFVAGAFRFILGLDLQEPAKEREK